MTNRPVWITLLLVGTMTLAACAGGSGAPGAAAPTTVASPSTTGEPEPPAEPSSEETPAAPAEGAYVDFADGVIEQTPGAKVLFFHAPWCPQCRALDEQLLAEGAPEGLTVFKVDYDSRTDLRQKYGVTLQTTVVFVDDSGELISSTVLYEDPSIASLIAAAP